MNKTSKRAVIIGAGLGGISAAVSLATAGWKVTICEKNSHVGGKLNVLKEKGFSFDLGPSILTLPHIFKALYKRAGKELLLLHNISYFLVQSFGYFLCPDIPGLPVILLLICRQVLQHWYPRRSHSLECGDGRRMRSEDWCAGLVQ